MAYAISLHSECEMQVSPKDHLGKRGEEKAFIVSVFGTMDKTISSLSTAHPLNCTTLQILWDEVKDYWAGKQMDRRASVFTN
jgi:hypothetical protein